MICELDSEIIVLNYFAKNPTEDRLSIPNLGKLANKIAERLNYSVIIDTTRDSIDRALYKRSNLLKLENHNFVKKNKDDLLWKHIFVVNMDLPTEITEKMIEALDLNQQS